MSTIPVPRGDAHGDRDHTERHEPGRCQIGGRILKAIVAGRALTSPSEVTARTLNAYRPGQTFA